MSICINSSIECEREASTIGGLCHECDKIQMMNPEDRAIARGGCQRDIKKAARRPPID